MGTYHFMGVGKAVGTVSCAVDYIEKSLELVSQGNATKSLEKLFLGTGGINHNEEKPGSIEALVLFSSNEVVNRQLKAFQYEGCSSPGSVRDEIEKQLNKLWTSFDPDEGKKVFWVEVDIDDYQDCFEKAMKVAHRLSPRGKQGKEIWLNLTGGTNSIGLALMSMARLTGNSTKHYLISQSKDYQKYVVTPPGVKFEPNKDNYFNLLPFLKLTVDTINFYEILQDLSDVGCPLKNSEIYSRVCNKRALFSSINLDEFTRDYLLRLFGLGYTQYDQEAGLTSITPEGESFVDDFDQMDYALQLESELNDRNQDIVEESKEWGWFSKVVLS